MSTLVEVTNQDVPRCRHYWVCIENVTRICSHESMEGCYRVATVNDSDRWMEPLVVDQADCDRIVAAFGPGAEREE